MRNSLDRQRAIFQNKKVEKEIQRVIIVSSARIRIRKESKPSKKKVLRKVDINISK
jgi:hypothetical protein